MIFLNFVRLTIGLIKNKLLTIIINILDENFEVLQKNNKFIKLRNFIIIKFILSKCLETPSYQILYTFIETSQENFIFIF